MTKEVAILLSVTILCVICILVVRYVLSQLAFARILDKQYDSLGVFEGTEIPPDLSQDFTESAITGLIDAVKQENPDYIVGVHTGGRLISVLAAEALELPSSKLRFASTDMQPQSRPYFVPAPGQGKMSGKVLVLDDITRTGSTLEIMRRQFIRQLVSGNSHIRSVDFFVLLVAANRKRMKKGFFKPDWWAYFTQEQTVRFPWSPLSDAVRHEFMLKNANRQYDERAIETHRLLITDFDFALFCAKLALSDAETFQSAVGEWRLIRKYWDSMDELGERRA